MQGLTVMFSVLPGDLVSSCCLAIHPSWLPLSLGSLAFFPNPRTLQPTGTVPTAVADYSPNCRGGRTLILVTKETFSFCTLDIVALIPQMPLKAHPVGQRSQCLCLPCRSAFRALQCLEFLSHLKVTVSV